MGPDQHAELVRRSFEAQVPLFSGPDSPFARRVAGPLSWVEPLDSEMIVLDVACGAAHATEPVAPQVRQAVGIDLTDALLRVGALRLRDNGIDNVLLQQGDAEALPFTDESFDVVFCRASLHHFGDPQQAVAEMVRVCRSGGRVVLLDLVAPAAESRDLFDHVHRLIDPSHVRAFSEAEIIELLRGRVEKLTYGETSTIRVPIDFAFSDHSQPDEILGLVNAEMRADGPATGFEPAEEDGKVVVSFTTCVVHGQRP